MFYFFYFIKINQYILLWVSLEVIKVYGIESSVQAPNTYEEPY